MVGEVGRAEQLPRHIAAQAAQGEVGQVAEARLGAVLGADREHDADVLGVQAP